MNPPSGLHSLPTLGSTAKWDGDTLVVQTIGFRDDHTAPWTVKITQPLVLDSELIDDYCLEGEKDYVHMVGK